MAYAKEISNATLVGVLDAQTRANLGVEHPEYFVVIGVVTWAFPDNRGWRG